MFDNKSITLTNGVIVDSFVTKTYDNIPVEMVLKSHETGAIIRLPGSIKAINHFEIDNKVVASKIFHNAFAYTYFELHEQLNEISQTK